VPDVTSIFLCLRRFEWSVRLLSTFRNMLACHSTPKLYFHLLSAVPYSLFIISAGIFRIWGPSPLYRNMFSVYGKKFWGYHPCQLLVMHFRRSCLPSTTWGRAVPWWQGPAYHGEQQT
jgi:hypothetical protein